MSEGAPIPEQQAAAESRPLVIDTRDFAEAYMPANLVGVHVEGDLAAMARSELLDKQATESAERAKREEEARRAVDEERRRAEEEARAEREVEVQKQSQKLNMWVDTSDPTSVNDWERYLRRRELADNRGDDSYTLRNLLNNATTAGEAHDLVERIQVADRAGRLSKQEATYYFNNKSERAEDKKVIATITPDEVLDAKYRAYYQYNALPAQPGEKSERQVKGDKTALREFYNNDDPREVVDVLADSIRRTNPSMEDLQELLATAKANGDVPSARTILKSVSEKQQQLDAEKEAARVKPFRRMREINHATMRSRNTSPSNETAESTTETSSTAPDTAAQNNHANTDAQQAASDNGGGKRKRRGASRQGGSVKSNSATTTETNASTPTNNSQPAQENHEQPGTSRDGQASSVDDEGAPQFGPESHIDIAFADLKQNVSRKSTDEVLKSLSDKGLALDQIIDALSHLRDRGDILISNDNNDLRFSLPPEKADADGAAAQDEPEQQAEPPIADIMEAARAHIFRKGNRIDTYELVGLMGEAGYTTEQMNEALNTMLESGELSLSHDTHRDGTAMEVIRNDEAEPESLLAQHQPTIKERQQSNGGTAGAADNRVRPDSPSNENSVWSETVLNSTGATALGTQTNANQPAQPPQRQTLAELAQSGFKFSTLESKTADVAADKQYKLEQQAAQPKGLRANIRHKLIGNVPGAARIEAMATGKPAIVMNKLHPSNDIMMERLQAGNKKATAQNEGQEERGQQPPRGRATRTVHRLTNVAKTTDQKFQKGMGRLFEVRDKFYGRVSSGTKRWLANRINAERQDAEQAATQQATEQHAEEAGSTHVVPGMDTHDENQRRAA